MRRKKEKCKQLRRTKKDILILFLFVLFQQFWKSSKFKFPLKQFNMWHEAGKLCYAFTPVFDEKMAIFV